MLKCINNCIIIIDNSLFLNIFLFNRKYNKTYNKTY